MRSLLWSATLGLGALAVTASVPAQAQASWLSEAVRSYFSPGHRHHHHDQGPYYGNGHGHHSPGYYRAPSYSHHDPYCAPHQSYYQYGPSHAPHYGYPNSYDQHGGQPYFRHHHR